MSSYIIHKVLSNNVVLVHHRNTKFILIGKGIGFSRKKGQTLNEVNEIEAKFISLDGLQEREYSRLVKELDPKVIELTQLIIKMAENEVGQLLDSKMHAGLLDHIQFALKRLENGIVIINPFLQETKLLYPREFCIAEKAVQILREGTGLEIPEAEIGFLTFHICGGLKRGANTEAIENTKLLNHIVQYVREKLDVVLEPNSFTYTRFMLHIRGVLFRLKNNQISLNSLLEDIKEKNIIEYKIAYDIAKMMGNKLNVEVVEDEIGYIAIHLVKLKNDHE